MNPRLILTVGTGTAGRYSSLSEGLRHTLELLAPSAFWLVPSTSPDSIAVADLVREGFDAFRPWSATESYRCVPGHDSLESCRTTVREVIAAARADMPRDTRLLVNPTSGTKQMSVGAALAALDEGVGEIVFTVGLRHDGVVITGTERLESFDASGYFAARDLARADELFAAGAFGAAALILRRHPALRHAEETALCCHEWDRQNYEAARRVAAAAGAAALAPLRHHLTELAQAASAPGPQPLVVADLLQCTAMLLARRDFEGSLAQTCRALEAGLRLALFRNTGMHEPYPLEGLDALPVQSEIKQRARVLSRDGRTTLLNLQTVSRILAALNDPCGVAFAADRVIRDHIEARNALVHSIRAISEAEAASALDRTRHILAPLNLPVPPPRPDHLPRIP